ncbi:unnamed protein product [Heterobilharzia americana]|nr:unnamed protein product [Heterobilharzia americana]
MSFYPGTTERVCLIIGSFNGIITVHNYVMDRIMEKPDPNPHTTGEGRLNVERHKQVKILVPNSTAGMVIGKGGSYIQEIKEKTGAYVQISQKSREFNLLERCIVIAGELDQTRAAVHLILGVIAADPQSASCPNLSYHDIQGPVASVYPTGSPYAIPIIPYLSNPVALPTSVDANSAAAAAATMMAAAAAFRPGPSSQTGNAYISSQETAFGFFPPNFPLTPDVTTLAALVSNQTAGSIILPSMLPSIVNGRTSGSSTSGDLFSQTGNAPWSNVPGQTGFDATVPDPNATGLGVSVAQHALTGSFVCKPQDSQPNRSAVSPPVFFPPSSFIPAPLRMSPTALLGYPTLGYGSLPSQQGHLTPRGIPPLSETCSSPVSSTSSTFPSLLTSPSVAANVALAALSAAAAIASTTTTSSSPLTTCTKPLPVLPNPGAVLGLLPCSPLSSLAVAPILPQVISNDPITMSVPNLPSASSLLLSLSEGSVSPHGLHQQPSLVASATSSPQATALPSPSTLLGLHGLQYSASPLPSNMVNPLGNYVTCRRVICVPENVISIILGHQGRSIMDLQLVTGTAIQISQKNIYLTGAQNRTVTITGPQANVQWAASVIEHIIAMEHIKRECGSNQQSLTPESDYLLHAGISYPFSSLSSVIGSYPEYQITSVSNVPTTTCVMSPLTVPVTTSVNGNTSNITGLSFSLSSCEMSGARRSGVSSDSLYVQSSIDSVPVHVTKRDETN